MWSGGGWIVRCFGALLLMQVVVVFGIDLTMEQMTDFDLTNEELDAAYERAKIKQQRLEKIQKLNGEKAGGFRRKAGGFARSKSLTKTLTSGNPAPNTDVIELANQVHCPPIVAPAASPADLPASQTKLTSFGKFFPLKEEDWTGQEFVDYNLTWQGNPYKRGVGRLLEVKTNGDHGLWKYPDIPKPSTKDEKPTTLRFFPLKIPLKLHKDPHWIIILIEGGVLRFRTVWGRNRMSPKSHVRGMLIYLKEMMKLVDPDQSRNMTVTRHIDDLYEKIQQLETADGQHMDLITRLQGELKRVEEKFDEAIENTASEEDLKGLREELTTNLESFKNEIETQINTVNASVVQNKREFEKKIDAAIAFVEKERDKLQAAIQQVENESVTNKERLDALTTRVNSLETKMAELKNLKQTVDNNYNDLKGKIDSNTNLIGSKEAEYLLKLDEIKKEIAALAVKHASDTTALKAELDDMETDHNAELLSVKKKLDAKISEATNLANNVNATLSKKIAETQTTSGSHQSSLDSLRIDVDKLKKSTEALQELNLTAHNHRSDLEKRIAADENKLKSFMNETKVQLEDVYAQIAADVRELEAVKKNLTDRIDEEEEEVDTEMEKIRKRLDAAETKVKKIDDLEKSTAKKFKDLKDNITKVQIDVEKMKKEFEKQIKVMDVTIDSHTVKLNTVEKEVSGMKTSFTKKIEGMNSTIDSQKNELKTLEGIVKQLKEENEKRFKEMDSKVDNLSITIQAVDATVNGMETTYDSKFNSSDIKINDLTVKMEAVEKNTIFDWDGKLYYPRGEL